MTDSDNQDVRIFPVVTRFQQLARRPGGVPRDKALEQAQAEINEIEPGFDEWLTTTLQRLDEAVNDGLSAENRGWVEAANFESQQLRDVGTTMGFELITFVANSLCELLDAIEAGADVHMDSIRCHVDALLLARHESFRGLKPEQVPELTSGLRRVVEHINTAPD